MQAQTQRQFSYIWLCESGRNAKVSIPTHAFDGAGLVPFFKKEPREEELGPSAEDSVCKRLLKASYLWVNPVVRKQGRLIELTTWSIRVDESETKYCLRDTRSSVVSGNRADRN